ncbi:Uncharacterised protein [uncultured Flavonifractor sp.]|nr:Uncharacterised protein [uncultured Flavonifractor sp.]
MILRLFSAGHGDYLAVLRRRCWLFILCIVLGLAAACAGFVLAFLDVPLPDMAMGFYGGFGTGIAICGVAGLIGTRRTMKDPKKLRASEIKETDERCHEVTRRAVAFTSLVLIVLLYVAMMVSIVVNFAVFLTLIATAGVFFAVFLASTAYYNHKL